LSFISDHKGGSGRIKKDKAKRGLKPMARKG